MCIPIRRDRSSIFTVVLRHRTKRVPSSSCSGLSGRIGSSHSSLALMIRFTFLPLALAICSCSLRTPVKDGNLSRARAEAALRALWTERRSQLANERAAELQASTIELAGKALRWEERVYGDAPTNGHSLWISMHGGGNAPARVN